MNIGILTFFESDNYGTVLQAFALQHYLETKCHSVELLRIKRAVNAASQHFSYTAVRYTFYEKALIKVMSFLHQSDEKKKKAAFKQFRDTYLHLSERIYETDDELLRDPPQYDLYLSGGDQIWNPYHKVFSYHYMLDFLPKGVMKASYSSSFGVTEIKENNIREKMCVLLSDYKAVSVREKSGVEFLSQI